MPRTLGSRFRLPFTKFKHPFTPETSSTLLWDLSPEDNNHYQNNNHPIFIKNYNSLYDYKELDTTPTESLKSHIVMDSSHTNIPSHSFSPSSSSPPSSSSSSFEPDLTNIFASQRFFFSSPGRSNSIIESTSSTTNKTTNEVDKYMYTPSVKDSVAVPTYSPDPYKDFRRSMQEMVEARDLVDVQANWESLHELLLCYLSLNPKSTHKFILGAFADLVVTLLSKSITAAGGGRHRCDGDVGFMEGS